MRLFTPYDTQWLTRATFAPTAARRFRKTLLAILTAFALVAAGVVGVSRFDVLSGPLRLVAITQQDAALRDEIKRARMDLEMERATRAELQRQIDGMSRQITDLNHQLEFLNSRNAQANRAN